MISNVLEFTGLSLIAYAAFRYSVTLGFLITGIVLLLNGFAFSDRKITK